MSNPVPPSTSAIATRAPAEEQPKGVGALRYFLVKLGGAAISLAMVILLGFFAFKILPGDPVASIARERGMSAEQADQLREQLGLNKPLWQQFVDYLGNVFTLNFGTSYVYRTSGTRSSSPARRRSSRSPSVSGSGRRPPGSTAPPSTASSPAPRSCSGRCRPSGWRCCS